MVNKIKDKQAMAKPARHLANPTDFFDEFADRLQAVSGVYEIYAEHATQKFYLTVLVRNKPAKKAVQASVDTLIADYPEAPIDVEIISVPTDKELCKQQEALADHSRIFPA